MLRKGVPWGSPFRWCAERGGEKEAERSADVDPVTWLFYLVAFGACILGKICGMGGGVIIKPVLDACGILSVGTINFLSGCTVLGMTCWSVGKTTLRRESAIDFRVSTPLAVGAALGGIAGKAVYARVAALFADADTAGGVQACLLFAATFATLLYTLKKDQIPSKHVSDPIRCIVIGVILGWLGAFLGIGGGPFNMAVLYYFFSMPTKTAAQNSLYIILFSQAFGVLQTVFAGNVPEFSAVILTGMVLCGVIGSEVGGRINKRMDDRAVTRLFVGAMVLILCINVYNIARYLF